MKKSIVQLIILVALFFTTYYLVTKVNWMKLFHVEKITKSTEEKLGDLIWKAYSSTSKEITNNQVLHTIDSIVYKICNANDIDSSKIKIHIIDKAEINAFALPNYHLAIYSGLINECENADELAGVVAHELAHMQKSHVMKKLLKEIGLGALITLTSGNGGGGTISETIRILSSSAYDRKLEREADITGVDYVMKAKINPEGLAQFLFRLSADEKGMPKQIFWVSTHPESEERAKDIMARIKSVSKEKFPKSSAKNWDEFKKQLDN